MMKHIYIFVLAIVVMLFGGGFCSTVSADDLVKKERTTKGRPSGRSGLYGKQSRALVKNFSLSLDATYYYGDMEVPGFSLKAPAYQNLGAHLAFTYHQTVHPNVKMNYTLGLGYTGGDNVKNKTEGAIDRYFKSFNTKVAVGAKYYPVLHLGLYTYLGLALQYNYVDRGLRGVEEIDHTFLPMIPIEIGYDFSINTTWSVGVHAGVSQGLIDKENINLDGWPGKGSGDSPNNKWADGYMYLGVSFYW